MSSNPEQERRWVLVTGASGGIGGEAVRLLDEAGFGVIAAARGAEDGTPIPGRSSSVRSLRLDVTDEDQVRSTPERVRALTGGRLFGLVNNAGIAEPGAFETSTLASARRQIETNVWGTLHLTHALLPQIREQRGRIVVVTSVVGRFAMPFNAVHSGTKHFLEGMFDAVRVEVGGAGVKTAIIEPGLIGTEMVDKFSASAEEALRSVPAELDGLYGAPVRAMREEMRGHIDSGSPPSVVGASIVEAMTAARPRTRYTPGKRAGRLTTLARLLPDRRKDALMARMLKLGHTPRSTSPVKGDSQ